jgi:hypothetical protein
MISFVSNYSLTIGSFHAAFLDKITTLDLKNSAIQYYFDISNSKINDSHISGLDILPFKQSDTQYLDISGSLVKNITIDGYSINYIWLNGCKGVNVTFTNSIIFEPPIPDMWVVYLDFTSTKLTVSQYNYWWNILPDRSLGYHSNGIILVDKNDSNFISSNHSIAKNKKWYFNNDISI